MKISLSFFLLHFDTVSILAVRSSINIANAVSNKSLALHSKYPIESDKLLEEYSIMLIGHPFPCIGSISKLEAILHKVLLWKLGYA